MDCKTHLIVRFRPGTGPTNDSPDLKKLLPTPLLHISTLVADAGYDGEPNHKFLRDDLKIKSFIPPTRGRPTTKTPTGYYRAHMKKYFKRTLKPTYGQRWQVETAFSMLKRNLTSALSARSYWARARELALFVLAHNFAILGNW